MMIQPAEDGQFIIGADVIAYLVPVKYPIIMVDRVLSYSNEPISLVAERYISANEPVFTGHFPNMKLWPGVYTIEGFRQSCMILYIMHKLAENDLLKGVRELQKRQVFRPHINHELCQDVIDYLRNNRIPDTDLFSVSIKLLQPVFAGSLLKYHITGNGGDYNSWSVSATVDERLIAKGELRISFSLP